VIAEYVYIGTGMNVSFPRVQEVDSFGGGSVMMWAAISNDGHGSTLMLFCSMLSIATRAVCGLALSCCNNPLCWSITCSLCRGGTEQCWPRVVIIHGTNFNVNGSVLNYDKLTFFYLSSEVWTINFLILCAELYVLMLQNNYTVSYFYK
jgi:hypothetical protein